MALTVQTSPFAAHVKDLNSPALKHVAITPHATDFLDTPVRRIWVGTGGNLILVDGAGTPLEYKNLPDGTWLGDFVAVVAVRPGSGTSAADLVGMV